MPKPVKNASKNNLDSKSLDSKILKSITQLHENTLTEVNRLLSIWGMTSLQYYTLRILYENQNEAQGMPSGEIGKHLTTRVPDMTRLLDRMVDKGWLTKQRDQNNRRLVRARLTQIGIELVESAQMPLLDLESQLLGHLSLKQKKELMSLLDTTLSNFPWGRPEQL